MTWVAALFIVLAFVVLAKRLGMLRCAAGVVARSREALAVVRRRDMDELDKERAIQVHAKALFVAFVVITGLAVASLGIPVAVVWGLHLCGLVELAAVFDALLSWPVLVGGTVLGLVLWRPVRAPDS